MKKNNLLIFAPHYDNFIKGSGEEFANYYDEINVIIPKWKKINFLGKNITIFKKVNRKFVSSKKNIHLHEVEVSSFPSKAVNQVLNYINNKDIYYDYVLSHFLVPYGWLGNLLAKKTNVKSIIILHRFEIYDFGLKNILFKWLFQKIFNKADKIITVSYKNLEDTKRIVKNIRKVKVIYNGFNSNFKNLNKQKVRSVLKIPKNKKVVINVANYLVSHKNQINLLKAAKLLLKRRKDLLFYLIGVDKGDKGLIEDTIKKFGLTDKVFLTGPKPHEEIPLWMNAADLFVLPSYTEGNPTVMFECFGCGLPFVGAAVGGVPEVITSDDYGFIYNNPDDYYKLSSLISKALKKKWNNKKILDYSKKFTWKKITNKIIKECEKMR